jgi:two-component system nitrate/nitrite response regulator NarL
VAEPQRGGRDVRAPAPAGRAEEVPIRVLIVDDHALFSDAIQPLLRSMGMDIIGVAASGEEALEVCRRERPELALVDLGLPDMGGIAVGRRILEEQPQTIVLAVTGLRDPATVKEALRAGFHGYVTKDTPLSQFATAIQAALEGQIVVPKRTAPNPVESSRTPEERDAALMARQLTPRELEVLALLVGGGDNAQIARALHLSSNTVRTHVQSILTKLQVRSRLQAAAFAVRHQVVEVPGHRRYA